MKGKYGNDEKTKTDTNRDEYKNKDKGKRKYKGRSRDRDKNKYKVGNENSAIGQSEALWDKVRSKEKEKIEKILI